MANDRTVAITAELVSAYLANASVGAGDIPKLAEHVPELIQRIHDAFANLVVAEPEGEAGEGALGHVHADEAAGGLHGGQAKAPAVPIEESVCPNHVVCLEDGLHFRSLRPHLISAHGLTPDAYRAKWGLPADHPMVAPNYSQERAAVAKKIGLGKGGRGSPPGKRRG